MISLWYRRDLSQVQQWPSVRYSCHAGICGAACQDAAADARADDHRQPSDGRSADPAGGGKYTPNLGAFIMKFTAGGITQIKDDFSSSFSVLDNIKMCFRLLM